MTEVSRTNLLGIGLGSAAQVEVLCDEIDGQINTAYTDVSTSYVALVAADAVVTAAFQAADTAQRDTILIQSGIAAAGNSLATGTAAWADVVYVHSVSTDDNDGITLRTPTNTKRWQFVCNGCQSGNTAVQVFPSVATARINHGSAGAAYALNSGSSAIFFSLSSNNNEIWAIKTG